MVSRLAQSSSCCLLLGGPKGLKNQRCPLFPHPFQRSHVGGAPCSPVGGMEQEIQVPGSAPVRPEPAAPALPQILLLALRLCDTKGLRERPEPLSPCLFLAAPSAPTTDTAPSNTFPFQIFLTPHCPAAASPPPGSPPPLLPQCEIQPGTDLSLLLPSMPGSGLA